MTISLANINQLNVYILRLLYSWKVFHDKCNNESVALESLELPEDLTFVQDTLKEFVEKTGSDLAQNMLDNWNTEKNHFVKVSLFVCCHS